MAMRAPDNILKLNQKLMESPVTQSRLRPNDRASFEKLFKSSMGNSATPAHAGEKAPPSNFSVGIQDYFKNAVPARASSYASKKNLAPPVKYVAPEQSKLGSAKEIHPEIEDAVKEMSAKYGVPAEFVKSVIGAESNFNPKAVSHVGARGLMQLMPGTAADLGVKDSFDIRQNVEGGVKYLRQMMDMFGEDKRLALAAYNAGPGAVKKYGGVPPYKETRAYVDKILKDYSDKANV